MAALKAVGRLLAGKRAPTFEAFCGPSGQWFCREVAANGETVNISEAYKTKANAVRAAKRQAAQEGAKWRVIPI